MKVTICDRCGERCDGKKTIEGAFKLIWDSKDRDLCFDCAKSLDRWLEECQKKETPTFDPSALPYGMYRIFWKNGGYTSAAVGILHDGTRWFAPMNWTANNPEGIASTKWELVKSAEAF